MKKRLIIFLLITLAFLTSCSTKNKETRQLKQGEIIVTDSLNREVILEKNPQKIAAIFSPAVHMISVLGGSKQIQSVSKGNMRDKLLLEIFPEIKQARTPKGGGDFNIEELIREPSPDLIICDEITANDQDMLDKMYKIGIPVVTVDFGNIKEQKASIHMIGKILDKELKAKDYCDEIDSSMEFIKNRIQNSSNIKEKTIYHSVNELLRTDIYDSVTTEVIKQLNLKQLGVKEIGNTQGNKNYISLEELLSYDPDLFIVNGEDVFAYIKQSKQLENLKSYKKDHIYNMPTGISRWGQHYSIETALFSKWLARTAYPDDFKDIDMRKETQDFYKRYIDIELDDKTIDEILEGRKRGVWD